MPPKVKITKEDIVACAVELVRREGAVGLNARNVANALGCSTQPVFSNFDSMEQLRQAVVSKAGELFEAYISRETQRGEYSAYKASGIAYIRFAKEERELFKLLYMRDRKTEMVPGEELNDPAREQLVQENTGLEGDKAKLFHLEMWSFVHGIATMLATNFVNLEWELISAMLTDAYQGLEKHYGME